MSRFIKLGLTLCLSFSLYPVAAAIPPPDFILSVLQSGLQILGVGAAFAVALYFSVREIFTLFYATHKRKVQWGGGVLLLLLILSLSLWGYVQLTTKTEIWKIAAKTEI